MLINLKFNTVSTGILNDIFHKIECVSKKIKCVSTTYFDSDMIKDFNFYYTSVENFNKNFYKDLKTNYIDHPEPFFSAEIIFETINNIKCNEDELLKWLNEYINQRIIDIDKLNILLHKEYIDDNKC